MRGAHPLLAVLAFAPCFAAGATAQISRTCTPMLARSGGQGRSVAVGRGMYHQFVSGGVRIVCIGQTTTIDADSVAWYQDLNRLDFVGQVRFRDSTAQLEAREAQYYPASERLEAYGDVRLEDQKSRSVLIGPNLTYFREAPGVRDTTELFATRRPTVEYRPANADQEDPYLIRGDRVRLKGEGRAWAGGEVTIDRTDFSAQADSAALDFEGGVGDLIGRAEARGTDSTGYVIRGRHIAFRLSNGDLTWVQADRDAEAVSAEWRAVGDTIEFTITDNRIQAGGVWGESTRSVAESAEQTIEADSLAIDAPDQVLEQVRAYGAARATTEADSVRPTDWIEGDTVVAHFGEFETGRRGLQRLEATGNARALYHIYPGLDTAEQPAINYSRGRRIVAFFKGETLDRVNVLDEADGLFLEPRRISEP
jgi:lipopolysaccharide export system protein LptA